MSNVERTESGQVVVDEGPIPKEPPYGAMVVVYRRADVVEYLMLHRAHAGPEYEGDWAWGPPTGVREPGESIDQCAARELCEETGLELPVVATEAGSDEWPVYVVEASMHDPVHLSDEHDRFLWLPFESAAARVTPEIVRVPFIRAAEDLMHADGR